MKDKKYKLLFLNVQTLSDSKLDFIIELLIDFDVIFLSEVNNKQLLLNNITNSLCKYHFDESTKRLAMICRNSVNFTYAGIGKVLDQDREQVDKVVFQSNMYRFKLEDNRTFDAENVYMTPDISSENLKDIGRYMNDRGRTQKMYIAGGDFNVNWKSTVKKKKLGINSLNQMIKDYTRIRKYNCRLTGRSRTSKTLIDLIFTNSVAQSKVHKSDILKTDHLEFFDHFGAILELNFPKSKPYRDIWLHRDPYRRPIITAEHLELIKSEVHDLGFEHTYDSFMLQVKGILDKYVPIDGRHGLYKKRLYDVPYPKEIRLEIDLKHELEYKSRKFPSEEATNLKKKQRNKVTSLIRNFKREHAQKLLLRQPSPHALDKTMKFLEKNQSKSHDKEDAIVVGGEYGDRLVNHLAEYFRSRAEDLVNNDDIISSPSLVGVIKPEEVPVNTLVLHNYEPIDDIYKVIPKNKVSRTGSLDGVSSAILVQIWPVIKDQMNNILTSSLTFPAINQGYLQRVISKSSTNKPKIEKDMRPLGLNNALPKYAMSKFVWTKIRNHVAHILLDRNIYTYQGCDAAIIGTLDRALVEVSRGFFVIIQKFDFSNAFGTLFVPRLIEVCSQLNLGTEVIQFIVDFFANQSYCQTIMNDGEHGIYVSLPVTMSKGGPQGQCGVDVAFTLQQLGLSPPDYVHETVYMDDINDTILRCLTALAAIQRAKDNDRRLNEQSVRVGFKKNELKTTYIPVNFSRQLVIDQGIEPEFVLQETGILGFNFSVKNNGFCVQKAANDIISQMNSKLGTIHSSRSYINDHFKRVQLARKIIYFYLGRISLVYAYGLKQTQNPAFNSIRTVVNTLIRATGLRHNTPQEILDKCFGTTLEDFALHGVIINGLKQIKLQKLDVFGRLNKIRTTDGALAIKGTFMNFFASKWNQLGTDTKREILEFTDIKQIKNYLKQKRKLTYDNSIYENYYWICLRN